ncbi:class A beta-lactamase [Microvirga massiliensis]|uniref:class A beta-lactamase n=1 Tax=Microvirga massiliensis TaxID=1033741 RepID=UPI000938A31B|nr:class A beta-lactamase [Microvirga massiliensis]
MITRRQFAIGSGAGLLGGALGRVESLRAANAWSGDLSREIARIESGLEARLGVAVLDTATGQRMSHRGSERFPMCSTFKMLACAAVLRRVDAGQEDLERRIRFGASDVVTYSPVTKDRVGDGMTLAELCEAAMTQSDNTAGNLILKTLGGPSGVTTFARSLGDLVTRLDRWETDLNEAAPGDPRDTTTPDAMTANLHSLAVDNGLSPQSRDQLTAWLVANKTGDARLRAGLPKNWRIGDKTGSGERGTANDVAVIWPPQRKPLIVSVYLTETKASSDERNAAIAEIGRAVKAALTM